MSGDDGPSCIDGGVLEIFYYTLSCLTVMQALSEHDDDEV